ncbi:pseudouridine-5'-phosphatase-like [Arctopsyche grandis]|uniref:pseudouridine-5'-phosphatase-like n=1 Tax=Arctopsyche grandis TaxID=121162 RepID=UPI00406D8875
MSYNKVTHVMFDMDGLLIDSERLYTVAFQNVVSKYGKNYTWDLKVQLMGKQGRECAEIIIEKLELPLTIDEFISETKKHFEVLFPNVTLMPGAQRLISHLHKKNVPFALATSSSEENSLIKMQHHQDFFQPFTHKVFGTSDPEVKRGKPMPDIFLICASRFPDKPTPQNCLVFEDAPNGVAAGVSAGMQVVMVPDPQMDESLTKEATQVLSSLEDFKPELFGLPPFED